jgi:hypothetical protein
MVITFTVLLIYLKYPKKYKVCVYMSVKKVNQIKSLESNEAAILLQLNKVKLRMLSTLIFWLY